MNRCLDLGRHGLGSVASNPLVGCVIVKDGKIIGEGFHREFGGNHAEVNAIESVSDQDLLKESTLFVNLEPCTHHGKTPPCVNRIIDSGISKVVIANTDPHEKVNGTGVKKLREHGIEVEVGILKEEENRLNKRFRIFHKEQRPYIILKWAQSADAFIDKQRSKGEKGQFRISGEASKRLLHKWRSEESAILIGTNTALNDDPQLNVRLVEGKNPLRLVVDLNNRLPQTLKLFTDGMKTVVYTSSESQVKDSVEFVHISNSDELLPEILKDLYKRDILSVMIEGGAQMLNSFLSSSLWDEIRVFESKEIIQKGLKAPKINIEPYSIEPIGEDTYLQYFRS